MPKATGPALRATLFTDIVGSTDVAGEMGDERWTRLLEAQRRIVRAQLKRHRGREVDTAGDGFFALFDRPADAIRCAFDAVEQVQELGVDIRAGIHFGEVETAGGNAHGMVVHTGARVMGQGDAAEVLVTQTVRDLVAGARIAFTERDEVTLKGVPGTWRLATVVSVDDRPRASPLTDELGRDRRQGAGEPGAVSRKRPLVAIGAVAAVLIAGMALLWMTRDGDGIGIPAAGTLARIVGDTFGDSIAIGSTPDAVAVGSDVVWVTDRTGQLYSAPVDGGGATSRGTSGVPTGLAVTPDAVWITNGFGAGGDGTSVPVTMLDTATGQLTEAFVVPPGSQAITIGAGAVWVASPHTGQVIRYDLVGRSTTTIDLPVDGTGSDRAPRPDAIAFAEEGGEAVWVGDTAAGRLYRVDATNPQVVQAYIAPHPIDTIVGGDGGLWLASTGADVIWTVDPASGAPGATVDVGRDGCNAPASLAITPEGVWVACRDSGEVVLVDTATANVTTRLAVDGVPMVGGGNQMVWAAVRGS